MPAPKIVDPIFQKNSTTFKKVLDKNKDMSKNSFKLTQDVLAWKKHHSSDIFRSSSEDPLGLDIVCVTGRPLAYNNFLNYFQKKAFKRMIGKLGNLDDKKVLDVGCGTGRWSKIFRNLGAKVTGIDLSEIRLENNKEKIAGVDFKCMSVTELDFANETFDVINSVTVLQHIPYKLKEKAINEIVRVTKKNGYFALLEGVNDTKDTPKFSFVYNTQGWISQLEKKGLKLVFHEKYLDEFLIDKYVAFETSLKKIARKILGIPEIKQKNIFDTSNFDRISQDRKNKEKGKKFRAARIMYRKINNFILGILTYTSYPLEYFNFYFIKKYNWHTATFLFIKK